MATDTSSQDFTPTRVVLTEDGSHTLLHATLGEHYHSVHGAIQESRHVFITNGWAECALRLKNISILEIGFGTGLNAYLSLLENKQAGLDVMYHSVEAFPINAEISRQLNYAPLLVNRERDEEFDLLHSCDWDKEIQVNAYFTFQKFHSKFEELMLEHKYDLVYFDAFSPAVQAELWSAEIFAKLYSLLHAHGLLVTYSAKGEVKRNLKKAGFTVVGKPGPPGKREMTVAYK